MLMAPLHLGGQDNSSEVQHYVFDYVMPLAQASHEADGIINSIIAFLRSR